MDRGRPDSDRLNCQRHDLQLPRAPAEVRARECLTAAVAENGPLARDPLARAACTTRLTAVSRRSAPCGRCALWTLSGTARRCPRVVRACVFLRLFLWYLLGGTSTVSSCPFAPVRSFVCPCDVSVAALPDRRARGGGTRVHRAGPGARCGGHEQPRVVLPHGDAGRVARYVRARLCVSVHASRNNNACRAGV